VRFELEDGGGFAAREKFVSFGVIQHEIVDVQLDPAVLLGPFERRRAGP